MLVLVQADCGGVTGLGYSYADKACAVFVQSTLRGLVEGQDPMDIPRLWGSMFRAVRNMGHWGVSCMAISAIDNALWDLKARLLDIPLLTLLGARRAGVGAYGSGGFTSYTIDQLQQQLGGWASQGLREVKMKIGTHPSEDLRRVEAAREAIGPSVGLLVDANGAYSRKQALGFAEQFAPSGVSWFEEPVKTDDLEGMRLMRDRAPAGMEIAGGEYGYNLPYYRSLLEAGAVDVVQADATRCTGISGFLQVAALCEAYCLPLSAHTAPSLHAHVCCSVQTARNVEYFHDHARVEQTLFEGALVPVDGDLSPDLSRPGNGLSLKTADADRFEIR